MRTQFVKRDSTVQDTRPYLELVPLCQHTDGMGTLHCILIRIAGLQEASTRETWHPLPTSSTVNPCLQL
jgi:hypothetical protein